MNKKDICVILETGANTEQQLLDLSETLDLTKENKMPPTERAQYQHNGSGTAIFLKNNIKYQEARNMFNTSKQVTQVIKSKNKNWIISGYHADNGNSKQKWNKINSILNDLDDSYQWPKVVYMDINTDVTHKKFIEWEQTLPSKGWNIYKSTVWTREGKGNQANTNIDVVLT